MMTALDDEMGRAAESDAEGVTRRARAAADATMRDNGANWVSQDPYVAMVEAARAALSAIRPEVTRPESVWIERVAAAIFFEDNGAIPDADWRGSDEYDATYRMPARVAWEALEDFDSLPGRSITDEAAP